MSMMGSQITSLTIVYSTIYSGADHRKHQSSESLAFVRGIHRWPVNSPRIGPATRKKFPFDDVIMLSVFPIVVKFRWYNLIRKHLFSTGPSVHVYGTIDLANVPSSYLGSDEVRPSASTMLTTKFDLIFPKFLWLATNLIIVLRFAKHSPSGVVRIASISDLHVFHAANCTNWSTKMKSSWWRHQMEIFFA